MKEMQKIRERLAAFKARSAWVKGVKEIAGGLLDKYEEIVRDREGSDPVPPLTEKNCTQRCERLGTILLWRLCNDLRPRDRQDALHAVRVETYRFRAQGSQPARIVDGCAGKSACTGLGVN